MMETTAVPQEHANQFASFSTEALKKTFDDMNEAIHAKATTVSRDLSSFKSGLENLLPYLNEMQSFLSQRGSAKEKLHAAGLPTWTAWFEKFNEHTKLNVTLRAVQKQLAKLRSTKPRKNPDPPVSIPQRDQRRLLKVNQYANEMVAAIENGANYSEPLRDYKKVAMDSVRIGQLLESGELNVDSEGESPAPALVAAADSVNSAPVTQMAVSAASQETPVNPQPLPLPKHGDWSGLVASVNKLSGKHLKAVLSGLEADVAANALEKFAQKIAQTYCSYEYGMAELQVTVSVLSRKASVAEKEKFGLVHGAA
jgi:hypothetical protein